MPCAPTTRSPTSAFSPASTCCCRFRRTPSPASRRWAGARGAPAGVRTCWPSPLRPRCRPAWPTTPGSARRVAYAELAETWPNLEWWLAVNPGLPIEGYLPAWFVAQLTRGDLRLPTRGPARDDGDAPSRIQDLHASGASQDFASPASGGPVSAAQGGAEGTAGGAPNPYQRGAASADPYQRGADAADPYQRAAASADPYQRAASADPYQQAASADPYQRAVSADPYQHAAAAPDPDQRAARHPVLISAPVIRARTTALPGVRAAATDKAAGAQASTARAACPAPCRPGLRPVQVRALAVSPEAPVGPGGLPVRSPERAAQRVALAGAGDAAWDGWAGWLLLQWLHYRRRWSGACARRPIRLRPRLRSPQRRLPPRSRAGRTAPWLRYFGSVRVGRPPRRRVGSATQPCAGRPNKLRHLGKPAVGCTYPGGAVRRGAGRCWWVGGYSGQCPGCVGEQVRDDGSGRWSQRPGRAREPLWCRGPAGQRR